MVRDRFFQAAGVLAAAALVAACAASPRTRPLNTGPINDSADSTSGVRRQLEGTWRLVSFETYSATGEATKHEAAGELTYDAYGNLVVRAALTGGPPGELSKALRYTGRAVVDPQNHRLVLQAMQGQGGEALPATVTPDNVRYYEFDGDVLRLTTKDANGRPTATITWKKAQ
jgi:YD repeat-containing protein